MYYSALLILRNRLLIPVNSMTISPLFIVINFGTDNSKHAYTVRTIYRMIDIKRRMMITITQHKLQIMSNLFSVINGYNLNQKVIFIQTL
jgi:hypothetical protein